MSPLGDDEYVADLAYDFGFPLAGRGRQSLGRDQPGVANADHRGHVSRRLGRGRHRAEPGSRRGRRELRADNSHEIRHRAVPPVLAEVAWQAERFDREVDWYELAREHRATFALRKQAHEA